MPSLIMAEYRCHFHGVFEVLLERTADGDAPDFVSCPAIVAEPDHACTLRADWTMSAPKQRILSVAAFATHRGGDMKDRPPGMLDTRPLAEGMKMSEWKKLQREDTRRRRHKQLVDKGVIQKKIVVG